MSIQELWDDPHDPEGFPNSSFWNDTTPARGRGHVAPSAGGAEVSIGSRARGVECSGRAGIVSCLTPPGPDVCATRSPDGARPTTTRIGSEANGTLQLRRACRCLAHLTMQRIHTLRAPHAYARTHHATHTLARTPARVAYAVGAHTCTRAVRMCCVRLLHRMVHARVRPIVDAGSRGRVALLPLASARRSLSPYPFVCSHATSPSSTISVPRWRSGETSSTAW